MGYGKTQTMGLSWPMIGILPNDNNAHIVVASDVFECGDEFCADLVIEGVEYIRSIERNGGHVVRDGERDGGEVGCGCHDLFTFR